MQQKIAKFVFIFAAEEFSISFTGTSHLNSNT